MKSVVKFVVILLAVVSPWIGNAQNTVSDPIERKANLTYLGTKDESSIVLLEVKNDKAEKLTVLVLQKNGTILYRENFNEKKITKRFFIPRDLISDVKIVISDDKEKNREEYQLNTRFVEEVYVSKSE